MVEYLKYRFQFLLSRGIYEWLQGWFSIRTILWSMCPAPLMGFTQQNLNYCSKVLDLFVWCKRKGLHVSREGKDLSRRRLSIFSMNPAERLNCESISWVKFKIPSRRCDILSLINSSTISWRDSFFYAIDCFNLLWDNYGDEHHYYFI